MHRNLYLDFDESLSFKDFMKSLEVEIKSQLGESIFLAWFSSICFKSYDGETLILTVKNDKIKNCIFLHYQIKFERIVEKTFQKHFKKVLKAFEVIVGQNLEIEQQTTENKPQIEEKFKIAIELDKKYIFDNLLEGNENKLAIGCGRHFAELISMKSENILQLSKQFCITGSIGNGKTHLAQAIAWQVKEAGFKVLYTTAERFLFNFQSAIQKNEIVDFTKCFLGIKLLIVDDIHFISTKKKTLEELQKVAYSVISDGGFVLFCTSNNPQNLPIENVQVKNFICSSHLIKIENPTEEFRYQILKFKTDRLSYKISDGVLKMLASKIQTNIRELEGSMGRMVLHSQILNHEISTEEAQFITTDIFPHAELKKFEIKDIQERVCTRFGISLKELSSQKRVKAIVKARQIAIYLATKLTTASYVEIGKAFEKTHSTVIHSLKSIEVEIEKSRLFKDELNALKISIEQNLQ
jgi:chromosomal replication initiator protein